MSRSFKRKPFFPITGCKSEKEDKQLANRRLRRKNKQEVYYDKETYSILREVSDNWDFGKDNKYYHKTIKNDTEQDELIKKLKRK